MQSVKSYIVLNRSEALKHFTHFSYGKAEKYKGLVRAFPNLSRYLVVQVGIESPWYHSGKSGSSPAQMEAVFKHSNLSDTPASVAGGGIIMRQQM